MLEVFFRKQSRIRKVKHGPLADQMDAFASQLLASGYSRLAAQSILLTAGELNNYLHARGLEAKDITPELVSLFTQEREMLVGIRGIPNIVEHFVRHLRSAGVLSETAWKKPQSLPPSPLEAFLERYADYMRNVRGASESYISSSRHAVADFLNWAFPQFQEPELTRLDGRLVLKYFASRDDLKFHAVGHIRMFCKYILGAGLCPPVPDVIFPKRLRYRLSAPPKHLPEEAIRSILASCERSHPEGMRDYAILLALVTLGLRSQEVSNLWVSDIDWRGGSILIRKTKVGRERRVTLSQQLGDALSEYLLYGRPNSNLPNLFLRHRAPGGPFTSKALYGVVRRVTLRAGVKLPTGGQNVFRHSLATHLVNHGISLKAISDLLDHRSPDTTAIYTMVDFATMRKVILPIPGGKQQ